MSQPVLPLLPGAARSVGPSVGLVEGPDGGVVLVFGLVTHAWAAGDELARRLAAVQLVTTRLASQTEVAGGFAVDTSTVFRWMRAYAQAGTGGLLRERTGPRGPSKLTGPVTEQIRVLRGQDLTIRAIAARTGVSTATVRVALGLVPARPSRPARRAQASQASQAATMQASTEPVGADHDHGLDDQNPLVDDDLDDALDVGAVGEGWSPGPGVGGLVVLARTVPRSAERAAARAAARAGVLVEAPVALTPGAHLPLAGALLVLPALEMTGLLPVAEGVFGPMRKGFYALQATLLTLVLLALLRQPRAEHLTRLPPADLGRLLGLDRAPGVKTLRRKLTELAGHGKGAQLRPP